MISMWIFRVPRAVTQSVKDARSQFSAAVDIEVVVKQVRDAGKPNRPGLLAVSAGSRLAGNSHSDGTHW